ncbi:MULTISPECIES: acyl-CoA dehydrogenase family protein [Candidatus Neomicrothrix]|jgi:alkylation response protein AidB-like acyl-CoA dehydrogenase|uniref:Putative acyl-CoA dehydrogenase domain protein n=1 Tax=Candidatus Neomicrothrix parvicella RN1 TaxID=1229780 RepID=R4Z253_9ACTN|nr:MULTISPECIES: acyl-CoA dehydrogenase family protein [Microthrix]MBL0205685.1 acyl-CoA dehydrogenase family protein [Candidatus Microthrix sp.]MBP6133651.1 acyl-CoA dehydrogenase family protein [Candidatus Microthrix sp.]MBP6148492.1 acyl-CoA dehydrogenase family protein [Candidatus Microthrix sp.]MBP7405629.1 acyl-CoA dehydrogenase family protein [Candidatus Microthrix sp.]MBP7852266.1 acyl-CoA dehydrogenase family protein [Candidatus Microthrix sp.]
MTDADAAKVETALDALLADHDPKAEGYEEFRGHQFDAGLAWVQYPEGNGGLGVAPQLQRNVNRRLAEAGAPPMDLSMFFIALAGPTIVTHGDEAVKQRFLRPMFTGEEKWCQLFSEPGAGSDFAGLGCKAVKDGDEWVINGQKVWNTLAHIADWGMLVARTDPSVRKHRGMTYFALDMHAPGVDVQPLRQITGEAEFNEVFMTDAIIPDAHRIGAEGEGWRAALTTLMNERTAIGGSGGGGSAPKAGTGPIAELITAYSDHADTLSAAARDEVMQLYVRADVLRLTNFRASQAAKAGNPGPEGSVGKAVGAVLNQEITEAVLDMMGPAGQVGYDFTFRRPTIAALTGGTPGHAFLRSQANTIEGGTTNIMKNILGEQVLGLPGEPRSDKDIPWIDVPRG